MTTTNILLSGNTVHAGVAYKIAPKGSHSLPVFPQCGAVIGLQIRSLTDAPVNCPDCLR